MEFSIGMAKEYLAIMVGFCIFFVVMYRACQKLINVAVTLFYLDWLYARYQRHLKSEGIRQFCFQNVAHKTTIDHCLTGKLSAVITSNIQKVLILNKCTRISNRTASLSFAYWIIVLIFLQRNVFRNWRTPQNGRRNFAEIIGGSDSIYIYMCFE